MRRVLLLHTGGTLGMAGARPHALKPGAFTRMLEERVPELPGLARLELDLFSNVDSAEMQPEAWARLARRLWERLPQFDGAVVTHGTDTLEFTASALSFMLRNLGKAVVLTGSQRPLGELRSDARLNLIDAVTSALNGPKEVTVCFDSKLYRGNRVRKLKVAEYDAFDSPNFPLLGTLGVETRFFRAPLPKGRPALKDRLVPEVFLLRVFPGLSPKVALSLLESVKGLVVQAYGAGTFPAGAASGRSLLPLFREARRRDIPVVVVSQVMKNGVDLSLYEAGQAALDEGAISGGDLTPSAALVKLMQALAYTGSVRAVAAWMQRPIAGEMASEFRRG